MLKINLLWDILIIRRIGELSIKVREYLARLEDDKSLPRDGNGFLLEDGDKVKPITTWEDDVCLGSNFTYMYGINNNEYYAKILSQYSAGMTNEIFMGRVFNDLGINSTIAYPMMCKSSIDSSAHAISCVATQDISNLNGGKIISDDAQLIIRNLNYEYNFDTSIWSLVTRPDIKACLLTIMTEECYNKMVNLFLLDNLVSSIDRHGQNYRFVKNTTSNLWEDVIALDHEGISITESVHDTLKATGTSYGKSDFNKFLDEKAVVYYPFNQDTEITHYERIKQINNLICSGELSTEHINFLKSATEYDIMRTYKGVHDDYNLVTNTQSYFDAIARLWDYNRGALELN